MPSTKSSLPERLLSGKVCTLWHCSRLRSVALYPWLIVVISVRQLTVAAISASLPGAGYIVWSISRQPDRKNQQRAERSEEIDVWAESPRLSPLGYLHHVRLSWAVNHYRDNATAYKAQRDKNARVLGLANAAITDMQMRQRDVAALDAKYTKPVSRMPKLKNDAHVMMLPLVVVGCTSKQSANKSEATIASGVDNSLPPTGRHRWTGLFHPQREADHYAKTTGRNPEVY